MNEVELYVALAPDHQPGFLMSWYYDGQTGQSLVNHQQMVTLIMNCKAFEFEYAE